MVRNRNADCLRCARACTSGCIHFEGGRLAVDLSKCIGCGTCATVCPTCALEAHNPGDADLLREARKVMAGGRVRIACRPLSRAWERDGAEGWAEGAACEERAGQRGAPLAGAPSSKRIASGGYVEVVCLGRVEEALILELGQAGAREVELACGPCASCANAEGRACADMVANSANALLEAWGSPARARIGEYQVEGGLPGNEPIGAARVHEQCEDGAAAEADAGSGSAPDASAGSGARERIVPKVMKDGTLAHFLPDRRERLLDALASLGEPISETLSTRLWGAVVINGMKCVSCRMCATFCPTGAIRRFDDVDGAFGVEHFPGDCVKCGTCKAICPADAILILDDVKPAYLLGGEVHRYAMRPREVQLNDPHQIYNTVRQFIDGDSYER